MRIYKNKKGERFTKTREGDYYPCYAVVGLLGSLALTVFLATVGLVLLFGEPITPSGESNVAIIVFDMLMKMGLGVGALYLSYKVGMVFIWIKDRFF